MTLLIIIGTSLIPANLNRILCKRFFFFFFQVRHSYLFSYDTILDGSSWFFSYCRWMLFQKCNTNRFLGGGRCLYIKNKLRWHRIIILYFIWLALSQWNNIIIIIWYFKYDICFPLKFDKTQLRNTFATKLL